MITSYILAKPEQEKMAKVFFTDCKNTSATQIRDYWTEAVVFTTSNNSFGPTEISYLENRFCNLATAAKRYIVRNGNDPTPGNITEEKESELEEFIDYAKIVMGTFGHKVFEPLINVTKIISDDGSSSLDSDEQLFYFERASEKATGRRTSEGFVVYKYSILAIKLQHSCPENVRRFREKYADKISSNGVLSDDVLLTSPSAAAAFVGGSSLSGNLMWKTIDGKTLKEVENIEANEIAEKQQ